MRFVTEEGAWRLVGTEDSRDYFVSGDAEAPNTTHLRIAGWVYDHRDKIAEDSRGHLACFLNEGLMKETAVDGFRCEADDGFIVELSTYDDIYGYWTVEFTLDEAGGKTRAFPTRLARDPQ